MLASVLAPYRYGETLVEAILRHGGSAALDRAFRNPPTTAEQVLFPERYLAGEAAVPIDEPPADGPRASEGSLGAWLLGMLLEGEPGAGAAAGWGGDRYVVWHDADRVCVRTNVVGDSPQDTAAFADSLAEWAAGQPDASVGSGTGHVTLTACNRR